MNVVLVDSFDNEDFLFNKVIKQDCQLGDILLSMMQRVLPRNPHDIERKEVFDTNGLLVKPRVISARLLCNFPHADHYAIISNS